MKNLLILIGVLFLASIPSYAQQDKKAEKLAAETATVFASKRFDLVSTRSNVDRVVLSIQNRDPSTGGGKKFDSRAFESFYDLERWLEDEEAANQNLVRVSGGPASCRSGVCQIALKDKQPLRDHMYLTQLWYGYNKHGIYLKRIRILFG